MSNVLEGTAHVYQRPHINTDEIIPARYLNVSDEATMAKHAMEDIDPGFVTKVKPGDFVIAGENFGCGSSREHAVWALRGAGIQAVIARNYARIFFRNALNNGFLALECAAAAEAVTDGGRIRVDLEAGLLTDLTTGKTLPFTPLTPFAKDLLAAGGLLEWALKNQSA
jgi:3-isopropylmalate/(R)-2-methylmalate dehydratase small subunit